MLKDIILGLLLLFAFTAALGSKENFIFLAFIPLISFPFFLRRKDYFHGGVFFLLSLISFYVAWRIFHAISGGVDIYARSTSFIDRLLLLKGIFSYDGLYSF